MSLLPSKILESKLMLQKAADETGWNLESMLDVICDYVNGRCDLKHFERHLQFMVEDELDYGDADLANFDEDGE